MPIFNVDGVNFIEENWVKTKQIVPKRKNMDMKAGDCDSGVDLNRQFEIDFGQIDTSSVHTDEKVQQILAQGNDHCFLNYPGSSAFSEPESQAFRDFLTSKKSEIDFVINTHSNGNAFIYPFNGRSHHIKESRPTILPIFTEIAKNAPFPDGELTGTSKVVMDQYIGGDQDDWTLGELGIPSITAEIGIAEQF